MVSTLNVVRGHRLLRAFATGEPLTRAQLLTAPVRWPRPSRLQAPLPDAPPRMAAGLRALGLTSVGALLEHLPRDSRDARTVSGLRPGEPATVAVQVHSIGARPVRRRGMKPLVEASVFDETGRMRATFFNQPWLAQRYKPGTRLVLHGKLGERGTFNVAHHAVGQDLGAGSAARPATGAGIDPATSAGVDPVAKPVANRGVRPAADSLPDPVPVRSAADPLADSLADLVPYPGIDPAGVQSADGEISHYPAADGVSSTQILTLVQGATAAGALRDVPEAIDARARASERLPDRASALAAMHHGRTADEREAGRERLAYEELLLAQLVFLRRGAARRAAGGAPRLSESPTLTRRWLEHELPFELTGDQRRAIAEIDGDLRREQAMQRLLLGEVGSGKTVVAAWAMLRAVEHGMQAMLMAPTETLAEQHFATLQDLLGGELGHVPCALLTGATSTRRRADALGKLSSGELGLMVGTHALIEPDVRPRALAVAVIDEQHRFGVRQRAALDEKGSVALPDGGRGGTGRLPHVLHMTATPIPRTLALVNYGDLDTTMLRELPRGRQPIRTRIVSSEAERARAYEKLREELRAGRQAYVVCPLIEDPDPDQATPGGAPTAGVRAASARAAEHADVAAAPPAESASADSARALRAAMTELQRLQATELKDHRLVLLHGGMRPAEKAQAMARFASGAADVLVATTVIEVGIDVPNATVIVVENAERFGISQLHQLRGRVGRGEHPSTCLLMGPAGAARLRALAEHDDGWELAEIDLRLRQEGELIGTRQSGVGRHRIASLPQDAALLERARARAQAIVARDPHLREPEHALLEHALARAFGAEAHAPIPG